MDQACIRAVLLAALGVCAGGQAAANELILEKESKVAALMKNTGDGDRLEASGVYALNGSYFVVFDNKEVIAAIDDRSWSATGPGDIGLNSFISGAEEAEGIAFTPDGQRVIIVEEERLRRKEEKHSNRNGRVFEYRLASGSDELVGRKKSWLGYNFQRENKGFEGLSVVRHGGKEYLLGLCEGNDCDGGRISRVPGNGRVKVFARDDDKFKFKYVASMDLPRSLTFEDFSGIDNRNGALAVVSQETSALWVGRFDPENWRIQDNGNVYAFPKRGDGADLYCNVEGVSWIDDKTLVVVSDAKKAEQEGSCAAKEQSIHVFRLPNQ